MRRIHTTRKHFFLNSFIKNVFLILAPILMIGSCGLIALNVESKNALKKNSYNVLYQMDETMNTLLSELDNVYYYVQSNPTITTNLKAAYNEREITLSSLRSINSICSLLRYYMYTSEYIETIYVYYYNNNNRILVPEKGMVSWDICSDTKWIETAGMSEADSWIEADQVASDKYSEPKKVIYYSRKLYSTIDPSNSIGVITVKYDAEKLVRYIDSLGLYKDQAIAVISDKNQILFQNRAVDIQDFPSNVGNLQSGGYEYYDVIKNHEKFTISRLHSSYLKNLNYFSIVPTKNIMPAANWFTTIFLLLVGGSIVASIALAVFKTQKEYKRLERILNLLSHPELATSEKPGKTGVFPDPYNYITYNIINLFIQQDYLKIQTSEQKYKLRALELAALQQQINPHFLNNTLNTIYWEAIGLTKGPNPCSEMLTKLASIMRYSLSNPDESVTIEEELSYLKSYVYIQSRRYHHKFSVEYDIDERVLSCSIRKIILQPLVENAINHGIKEIEGTGRIRIRIHGRPNNIYISVLDTGAGMKYNVLKELRQTLNNTEEYSPHVGLLNSHRRLILTYGEHAGLHICAKENKGTCVFFRF